MIQNRPVNIRPAGSSRFERHHGWPRSEKQLYFVSAAYFHSSPPVVFLTNVAPCRHLAMKPQPSSRSAPMEKGTNGRKGKMYPSALHSGKRTIPFPCHAWTASKTPIPHDRPATRSYRYPTHKAPFATDAFHFDSSFSSVTNLPK